MRDCYHWAESAQVCLFWLPRCCRPLNTPIQRADKGTFNPTRRAHMFIHMPVYAHAVCLHYAAALIYYQAFFFSLRNSHDYINKCWNAGWISKQSQRTRLVLAKEQKPPYFLPHNTNTSLLNCAQGHVGCLCPGPVPLQVTVGCSHTRRSHQIKIDRWIEPGFFFFFGGGSF